jgi:hypothetical protein
VRILSFFFFAIHSFGSVCRHRTKPPAPHNPTRAVGGAWWRCRRHRGRRALPYAFQGRSELRARLRVVADEGGQGEAFISCSSPASRSAS